MDKTALVEAAFIKRFGTNPTLVRAPGRINLIGEHTDYNEGFVMPAAIDRYITFAVAPNNSDSCTIISYDFQQEITFQLTDLQSGDSWVNYLMGVLHGLRQIGLHVKGVSCVFGSTIPVGAGLSSSAALCCGFGWALSEIFNLQLSRLAIAKVAQYSEHHFAGVMCGIMDQYGSLFGVKDAALLLDCKNLTHEVLPIELADYRILLIDTKVKHSLASTAYNQRREACELGVRILQKYAQGVTSLRDVDRTLLYQHQDELGDEVFVKCLFVVEEIARTQQAAEWLKSNQLEKFGALLYETHWGLSQAYEVSCAELDFLVSLAEEDRSVVPGARMMGGGFGGCTINLVRKDKIDYIRGYVHEKYFATFEKEPDFYLMNLSQGVHSLT